MRLATPPDFSHSPAPRSFAGLMELYEQNYMLLRRLLGDIQGLDDRLTSQVEGCLDLHVEIIERSKYTSTLRMTYHLLDDQGAHVLPDIKVRVYHDARSAEALSRVYLDRHHHRLVVSPTSGRQARWQLNRFLNKWLRYCLQRGHSFKTTFGPEKLSIEKTLV